MKTMINFTTSADDLRRFDSAEDLRCFYQAFGCSGLELMPLPTEDARLQEQILLPDMIVGIHANCFGDWMYQDREFLLQHFRRDLEIARKLQAEYLVFHVTQVTDEESFTYQRKHTDEEVVDFVCEFVNLLLDGQGYDFYFLMENLWWPGLNFLRPAVTKRLLDGIHYEKKGLMLDTGHFLHTNQTLRSQKEALSYLHQMLDAHEPLLPYFKGIHLQQSLSGSYVQKWLQHPPALEMDPEKRFCQVYEHIFSIDQHQPFTEPGVQALVERIQPLYLTYEYITKNRKELRRFLQEGSQFFR